MTDFNALLDKQVDKAERPKPTPAGTYTFAVKKHEFGESKQKKTPYVEFTVGLIAPGQDVDQAELSQVENWNQREMRLTFYLTEDSLFRLREFSEHCGLDISGKTFSQIIPDLTGCQFTGMVEHQVSTRNPGDVFANIGRTAAA